ncbi:MAG: ApaLI family restriction endonuclease [Bacteroidia bacterium]
MDVVKAKIKVLALAYASNLKEKITERKEEMKNDDNSHYLVYQVLGISEQEGADIDIYQNIGRFLYKYAGAFLEEAAILCLLHKYPNGAKTKIDNTQGLKPKTFEIDFLNESDAIEVKWKDATTDGDHITKEHTRVKAIQLAGYKPIRIMFFNPQRAQAIKIQETLKTLYLGVKGEYYAGDEAWAFLLRYTGIDLKTMLEEIIIENSTKK